MGDIFMTGTEMGHIFTFFSPVLHMGCQTCLLTRNGDFAKK